MKRKLTIAMLALSAFTMANAQSLCEPIADMCEKHITAAYIPDGQFYRALLNGDETAEFGLTLYGGTTYRVAACSGTSEGNLLFSVYDQDHELLFTNREHNNEPFWDLAISNTLDVSIEAELDGTKLGSGCAVLLIGFKK